MTTTLKYWLITHCRFIDPRVEALPGDASFRRYFRVREAGRSYIAMDAAEEKHSCLPFTLIARALQQQGLQAPEIFASDFEQGFLLLTDFGQRVLLQELNNRNAQTYYTQALDALQTLQTCQISDWQLKTFSREFARNELDLFQEWFLEKYLKIMLTSEDRASLAACFDFLAESIAVQPQVLMHRDYHSANLMVLPKDQLGILDFQDAMIGPVTYDIVSLLRDCYIAWPEKMVIELALYFWQKMALPGVSSQEFLRWFDVMSMQRHLKALLTFSRKYKRDNNANYLQHIPRTLNYLLTVSVRYPECEALKQYLTVERCVE